MRGRISGDISLRGGAALKGAPGTNGISPTIAVTDITGGHCVTITGADGAHSFNVPDGEDGHTPVKGVDYNDGYTPVKGVDYSDGEDGYTPVKGVDYFDGEDGHTPVKGTDYFDGEDGVSPAVSVSDITGGHKVTITDADGVHSFDVMNGQNGQPGASGISVTGANVNASGHLIITLSNGSSIDAGIAKGSPGASGIVNVAYTLTGAAGSNASVENIGTPTDADLVFTIPRGAPGSDANVTAENVNTAFGVSDKGLSKNDYTDADKAKVSDIPNLFLIKFQSREVGTVADKTEDEILDAYFGGKTLAAYISNAMLLPLSDTVFVSGSSSLGLQFSAVGGYGIFCRMVVLGNEIYSYDVSYLEKKGNKVTSIDSASTDEQYPTAKAAYDAAQTANILNQDSLTDAQKQTARDNISAEPKHGEYELIEEITLTDDVFAIDRTMEPDGTLYNFESCIVMLEAEAYQTACSISMFFYGENFSKSADIYMGVNTTKRYSVAKFINNLGSKSIEWCTPTTAANLAMTFFSTFDKLNFTSENVNAIRVMKVGSGALPGGSVIKIYGVRA